MQEDLPLPQLDHHSTARALDRQSRSIAMAERTAREAHEGRRTLPGLPTQPVLSLPAAVPQGALRPVRVLQGHGPQGVAIFGARRLVHSLVL